VQGKEVTAAVAGEGRVLCSFTKLCLPGGLQAERQEGAAKADQGVPGLADTLPIPGERGAFPS
jgi:hypothetical protein